MACYLSGPDLAAQPAPSETSTPAEEKEATGLDYVVETISVTDQSLTEFVQLLAEIGQIAINVRNTVPKDIKVAINVPQPKSIRKILDDLATQYDLWIEETPDGGVLIRPSTEKPEIEQRIVERDFPLNFSRPSEVLELIRTLLSDAPEADAIALDQLSVIRVRDIPEAVARIEEFLNRVDRPQQTVVFPILYGDPDLISTIIQERIPTLEEGAMTVDLVNSQILVRTTLENLAEIQLLIETLDIKKEIRIFHIGFHPVEDVIAVLEDLKLLSQEATITSNEFTGKLIIQDTVERLDRIAEAIRAYDQPRPLVFFEAEILDVNADYNFNWDPRLALEDAAVPAAATGSDILRNIQDGQTGYFVSGTDSFQFITLEANNYLAQLQANENDSDVHTIASPRVLVEMQEEARLNVGSEEPFGVRTFQPVFGGTGSDIFTSRVREVGVRLIIFVRNISDRGYVEFEVGLENSALGGRVEIAGDGTEGLRVLTTNVETVAIVKDGRTLVVGGLTQRMQSENNRGFPFLSKVPGVRYLFTSMTKQDQRRKLLMFITPRILNIDTPLEKYGDEKDDEILLAADKRKGDIAVPASGRADLTSTQVGSSGPLKWINRDGRWGYLDSSGKFVDRTELYLEAYAEDAEVPGATKAADRVEVEEPVSGPSAAELLRQLEELPTTDTRGASGASADVAQPRAIPQKPAPAPKSIVAPETQPKSEPAAPPAPPRPEPKIEAQPASPASPAPTPEVQPAPNQESLAPTTQPEPTLAEPAQPGAEAETTPTGPLLQGMEAMDALKKPAAPLGKVQGTVGELLERVRVDTGVKFASEPGMIDTDAPINIDAAGKTYSQVLMEALSGQNLYFTGRKDKVPLIRTKPQPRRAPTAAPPAGPESAPPPAPAPAPQPEQPADPQSRLDSPPWSPDYHDDRELTSSEWSALTDRAPQRRGAIQVPRTTPQLETWEVPVEVDNAPAHSRPSRLPHPDGYISRTHGVLSESVWSEMLDGDRAELRPLQEPLADGYAIPSRIREAASNSESDPWNGDPGYRAETVSMIAPNEASLTTSSREKRGAWNKLKNIFTRN